MTDLYFPCPICYKHEQAIEESDDGCGHSIDEREEAYTRLKFHASLGLALISNGIYDCMNDLDGPEDAENQVNKLLKACEPILDLEFERRDSDQKEYLRKLKEQM